jgi:outer membrane protein TolC
MSIFSRYWLVIAFSVAYFNILYAEPMLIDHAPASMSSSADINQERHLDTLKVNANLHLSDVLEKTFIRNPMQSTLQSRDEWVTSKKTLAHAMLPSAPAMSVMHQNDALGGGRGEREWQAELELPVWMPTQRDKRLKVANVGNNTLTASRESLKLQVAGLLRDALWSLALNESHLVLATNKLEVANKLQQDVKKRFSAGEVPKTDVMLTQQESLRAEQEHLRAEAEVMHARHRYYVLTGLREVPAEFVEQQSNLVDYQQSPIWLEAQSKLNLAQTERELAQVEGRENLQVLLNMRSIKGAFDVAANESVGVKLRIPFGGDTRAAPIKAAAEQSVGNALSEQAALQFSLETAMHEAEHNLEVSRAELALASKQNAIAEESLKLARKAFQLGETDLVSLLRVQARAFESERIFTSQKIQVQWDIARYNQTVGVLP